MIHSSIRGRCFKCGEETEWRVIHGFVDGVGLAHILECPRCRTMVPSYSWATYQRSGVAVQKPKGPKGGLL